MMADRDIDGDSEMLSGSSSPEDNTLEGGNHTPTDGRSAGTLISRGNATAELSPPASQDAMTLGPSSTQYFAEQGGVGAAGAVGPGGAGAFPFPALAEEEMVVMKEPATRQQKDYMKAEPGSAWNNKKAQEDYSRAMDNVVDRDFNLNEFGDPFDERDLEYKAEQS